MPILKDRWAEVSLAEEEATRDWEPVQEQEPETKPVKFPHNFTDIPQTSPVHRLKNLKRGWDGYDAEPINLLLLHRAQKLWDLLAASLDPAQLPQIAPGREDVVTFVWTQFATIKRLDIWLNAEAKYRAEWELERTGATSQEGSAKGVSEVIELVQSFLKD